MADSTRRFPFLAFLPLRARSRRVGSLAVTVGLTVAIFIQPGCRTSPPHEERSLRLACVGDSIAERYQMPDKARPAYPAQLARLLGAGWEVRNFGVSGATLMRQGGYPYHQRPEYGAALAWKPDVLVIVLGTNDTKPENIAAHPDDFVSSYRTLLTDFRASNPQVRIFLCLPPPVFPEAMGLSDRVLREEIMPRIRQVAAEENLPLIDLHAPLANAGPLFPDKVHPSPAGAGLIAQLVYGDLQVATQPPARALDEAVNTAVVPVPRLEWDSYNWWARHAAVLAAGDAADPEVVMIGDSITHFWAGEPRDNRVNGPRAWDATFGDRRVLNLGFGWDRTQNVLWRIDHGEFDRLRPKLVIVNIGTNNLSATSNARANTPAEIAEGIAMILERIRRKSPATHFLVMGVLPRGHRPNDGFRAPIAALNAILARSLAGKPGTTFVDIGPRFLAPDGAMPPELMPDGTHPSEQGYTIWGRAIIESGLLR